MDGAVPQRLLRCRAPVIVSTWGVARKRDWLPELVLICLVLGGALVMAVLVFRWQ